MNTWQKDLAVYGEDHRDPSYGDPITITRERYPGREVLQGCWNTLERARKNTRIQKYPWSTNVLAVKPYHTPQPIVTYRRRVTPAFTPISCSNCENYGLGDCTANLTKEKVQIKRTSGEMLHIEVSRNSAYTSVYMEDDGSEWIHRSNIQEALEGGVQLPVQLTRDEYDRAYNSPEAAEALQREAHCKPYQRRERQGIVWIQSRDGQMYVIRKKDLNPRGGIASYSYKSKDGKWQGPNNARHLPYIPNEIWSFVSMPVGPYSRLRYNTKGETIAHSHPCSPILGGHKSQWQCVGNFSDEQSLGMTGYGPAVQPGKLDTLPYFETDRDDSHEDMDFYDSLEYNGPMEISAE